MTGWVPGIGVAALVALAGLIGWASRAIWLSRAARDPRLDPAARWVTPERRAALEALLAAPGDAVTAVERGLTLCAVHERLAWRGGLRRLEPVVAALPDDAEGRALRAEVALALGHLDQAAAQLQAVPADHWRACTVRARLYELDGDVERAESALVAARWAAPPDRRSALGRELGALRARHRRTVGDPLRLWERPPE